MTGISKVIRIGLELPYRSSRKDWRPTLACFAKAGKRMGTTFSQSCYRFMIERNDVKDTKESRITGKINVLTVLRHIDYKGQRPVGRNKYALILSSPWVYIGFFVHHEYYPFDFVRSHFGKTPCPSRQNALSFQLK